jgi:formate hydrogenlyase transcriptional activator
VIALATDEQQRSVSRRLYVIERAAILARGPIVEIDEALEQRLPPSDHPLPAMSLQDVERAHILRVLADTHGVIEGPRGAALGPAP